MKFYEDVRQNHTNYLLITTKSGLFTKFNLKQAVCSAKRNKYKSKSFLNIYRKNCFIDNELKNINKQIDTKKRNFLVLHFFLIILKKFHLPFNIPFYNSIMF